MNPRLYRMDSSPTPRALVVYSYEQFINSKSQNKVDNLQRLDLLPNTFLLIVEILFKFDDTF